jgi:hypothetical protein
MLYTDGTAARTEALLFPVKKIGKNTRQTGNGIAESILSFFFVC